MPQSHSSIKFTNVTQRL